MRIKEIELVGFKSFVDKTRLSLNEGICGIVGPNGCGKSNVVDAIRWCMGEMSAKSLRGSEMQDVIFNGAETRKPMGMAQVSVIFDCSDGRFPPGYDNVTEIQVTRRLYRSGESEYLINRQPCRLKDIIDLFLDTGVGSRSYAVIEQGQIAKVLAAKPLERRFLIEEAAGISKYRVKKEEALRKIEATQINLARVSDLLVEINRTVSGLQRQAAKAERYHELKRELKEVDLELAARERVLLREQEQRVGENIARLRDLQLQNAARLEAEETRLAAMRLEMLEQEKAIAGAAEHVAALRDDIRTSESQRELLRRDIQHLESQVAAWNEEIEATQARVVALDQEIELSAATAAARQQDALAAEARLADGQQKLENAQRRRQELDTSAEAARRELLSLTERRASLHRAVQTHEERVCAHQARKESNESRRGELTERVAQSEEAVVRLRRRLTELQENRAVLETELAEKKDRLARMRAEVEEKRGEFERARESFDKARVRLESLEEMRRNLEGYQEGVRRIMEAARESSSGLNGSSKSILGLLAEKIEVPQRFETALEAVLGDRLQAVLVTDQNVGAHAADYLKTENAGRGSFVPLQPRTTMAPVYPQPTLGQTLGPLAMQVHAEPQYQPVVDVLLSNVLVVENLPTAVRLHQENGYTGAFVTLDGEVVDATGVITGGQMSDVSSGILQKKREIAELSTRVQKLEQEFQQAQSAFFAREGMIAHLEDQLREGQQGLDENHLAIAEASGELRRESSELDRLRAEREQLADEARQLDDDALELARRHKEEVRELADVERALTAAHAVSDEKAAAQAALAVEIDGRQKTVREAALAANDLRQEERAALARHDTAAQSRAEAAALLGKRQGQIESAARTQHEHRDQINAMTDVLTQKTLVLEEAERQAAKVREGADEKMAVLDETERGLKTLRRELEGHEQEIRSGELAAVEIRLKREHLAERLNERYQQALDDLAEPSDESEIDTEALSARQHEITERIARMGEVNPNAIAEYAEEKKRLDHYVAQKADLDQAIAELKEAITKINKTSKERFLETFHLVNDKFSEVIPLLFGGGTANLLLTEPDDPLESGVDIVVRPPGKKLTNINLLSGGEKALSSIGLIFSIFLIKPSPFCLLDEVDAPLDDENVSRFNQLVHKMAEHSQIIVITHNKETMECVDSLYGVTMQENGVSKLVSVRLVEEPATT